MWVAAALPGEEPIEVDGSIQSASLSREASMIAIIVLAVGLGTVLGNNVNGSWQLGSVGAGMVSGAFVGFVVWEVRRLGTDR
jgi:hypothetical protein